MLYSKLIIYIHGPCKIISMLKGNNLIPWYGIGKKNVGRKVVKITLANHWYEGVWTDDD